MIYTMHYQPHEVASYINWLYFFHAWGFPARYGAVSHVHGCEACRGAWLQTFPPEERDRASEALKLMEEAHSTLNWIDGEFRSHALVGLFDANSEGDDIVLRDDEGKEWRLPMLRQQQGDTCLCLSDFLLPRESGEADCVGLFVASVDEGLERSHPDDDFRHMMCQTLADRLAEATAERAHEEVRRKLWAYAPEENLTPQQLFSEEYEGLRPAVGYPSLPDQSLNFLIDNILEMGKIGVRLTGSGAMVPHASVSGLLFSHPKASHFSVGKIGQDQLSDYAKRRGFGVEEMKRFLTSNL